MPRGASPSPNFAFLAEHEETLVLLAAQAEALYAIDAVATITKVRVFGEVLAREAAARVGIYTSSQEQQIDLLRRLRDRGALGTDADQAFHAIRKAGNAAVHENAGDHGTALHVLKLARGLAVWFHRSFGKDRAFKPEPFAPPRTPADATASLRSELESLRAELVEARAVAGKARQEADDATARARTAEERAKLEAAEREAAEALMNELASREAQMLARLESIQAKASAKPDVASAAAETAAKLGADLELDEASTRRLIDEQLRSVGWEADTETLRYAEGTRPQKGKNLAIAEWPTDAGPADYVLFAGLTPLAVVEAKRKRRDVAGSLQQSTRYARGLRATGLSLAGSYDDGDGGSLHVPFLFATNGRPYLKQIAEKSGIWFRDARRAKNLATPLASWYSPDGLLALLKQDIDAATEKLKAEPTDYLGLRDYQVRAIHAVEAAIESGRRTALLALATGTGKTRLAIGLCYRLLKAGRFRRILFLVDRSALGIQAANAFQDARLESLQTFDSIFDLKTLEDVRPEKDTKLHIATVQGMVQRVLLADGAIPPVDEYDCIVVDECHRGYTLDREMSEGELVFRSEADYVSKYRRILEHFDAVKIGLTATPALHTTEIFGAPVFTYSYREAVIDGHLVDHEPPIRIVTALARDGIHWKAGEEVEVYQPEHDRIDLSRLPDDVDIDLDAFNREVRTESFNRVVCETLAKHIDPSLPGKTIVFCATDAHADVFVRLLKEAFAAAYGDVEDAAVVKITGTSDRPLELIRRFKNERLPNVAVTVDLLTTGVDVPPITNVVFVRRTKSRILYDQMLGRATRRCDEIGKEIFRVFDAVDLYEVLQPYSAMKPVVTDVSIPFATLTHELATLDDAKHREEVLAQFITKLDRRRRRLEPRDRELFEAEAGMEPEALLALLREKGAEIAKPWFTEHPGLGELLDRRRAARPQPTLISKHDDELVSEERGYGDGRARPEDYLDGFAKFVREQSNQLPALVLVTQRPRELTREQLKSIALALDKAGFSEAQLRAAWRDRTNQDVAASIIGHIRQAALGDPLVPYEERVAKALTKLVASRPWTQPQRKWLERIGKQLKAEVIVDRESLDRGQFAAEGGFTRMNKVFEGKLETILGDLADEVWR
ncbi:type I restriction-modification system endonuclease [Sandaracinus amylolyticus]|uniref:type I restriction-modification system endonuclease n=1 Tax=Sandaracinus amylolyticus TaxID=927083 RepID=UPI0022A6C7A6|nr:type I restriction-modification system endonuclease [Sandaracinus amylolyticus]UJR78529.1 Type I restriction-modification system endonuclease [Sandaracinus amylolyticus]